MTDDPRAYTGVAISDYFASSVGGCVRSCFRFFFVDLRLKRGFAYLWLRWNTIDDDKVYDAIELRIEFGNFLSGLLRRAD